MIISFNAGDDLRALISDLRRSQILQLEIRQCVFAEPRRAQRRAPRSLLGNCPILGNCSLFDVMSSIIAALKAQFVDAGGRHTLSCQKVSKTRRAPPSQLRPPPPACLPNPRRPLSPLPMRRTAPLYFIHCGGIIAGARARRIISKKTVRIIDRTSRHAAVESLQVDNPDTVWISASAISGDRPLRAARRLAGCDGARNQKGIHHQG